MTIKVSVYIATSLDGFIARRNGEIDWLQGGGSGEDFGYSEFISGIDHIVMGRNTFEKVLTFGEWPYGKPVIVLSHRRLELPARLEGRVEVLGLSPGQLLDEMAQRGAHHIYLDGGVTIQHFLRAGLVDALTLTILPVLIGEGIPLFGSLDKDVRLDLIRSKAFANGFVQNTYQTRG